MHLRLYLAVITALASLAALVAMIAAKDWETACFLLWAALTASSAGHVFAR